MTSKTRTTYEVKIEDLEYLRHGDKPFLARLFRPQGSGPFPVMVELHGGARLADDGAQLARDADDGTFDTGERGAGRPHERATKLDGTRRIVVEREVAARTGRRLRCRVGGGETTSVGRVGQDCPHDRYPLSVVVTAVNPPVRLCENIGSNSVIHNA